MSVEKLRIKKGFSFTVISSKVVQNLKNYEALGLYTYLLSLPEDWIFNKNTLAARVKIGRDKLNKLLNILCAHNLIDFAQVRTQNGQFAHTDLNVKDGIDFKINELENECTPCTEKPLTANQSLVNRSYKRNNTKDNKNTKLDSATDVAQLPPLSFSDFWQDYPTKKNKVRAQRIWKSKNLDLIAQKIIDDVINRKREEAQWQDKQFIPHPATYLHNELWNDEITAQSPEKPKAALQKTEAKCTVPDWSPAEKLKIDEKDREAAKKAMQNVMAGLGMKSKSLDKRINYQNK